jgi:hypothetical protein
VGGVVVVVVVGVFLKNVLFTLRQYIFPVAEDQVIAHVVVCM